MHFPARSSTNRSRPGVPLVKVDADRLLARPAAEKRRWVAWKNELLNGRPTKVPKRPTGANALSNKPSTWSHVRPALDAFESGEADGVGFVLAEGDGLVVFDLDATRDPVSEEITEEAQGIVDRLRSLTELSPSGTGLHVFVQGELPDDARNEAPLKTPAPPCVQKVPKLEVWDRGRYVAVTGHFIGDHDIRKIDADEMREILGDFGLIRAKPKPAPAPAPEVTLALDDEELVRRMFRSSRGPQLERLWRGDTSDHGNDRSAADFALVGGILWWAQGDEAQTDRIFRASGLMRPKWNELRTLHGVPGTYGSHTISRAKAGMTSYYDPGSHAKRPEREAPGAGEGVTSPEGCSNKGLWERVTLEERVALKAGRMSLDLLADDKRAGYLERAARCGRFSLNRNCGGCGETTKTIWLPCERASLCRACAWRRGGEVREWIDRGGWKAERHAVVEIQIPADPAEATKARRAARKAVDGLEVRWLSGWDRLVLIGGVDTLGALSQLGPARTLSRGQVASVVARAWRSVARGLWELIDTPDALAAHPWCQPAIARTRCWGAQGNLAWPAPEDLAEQRRARGDQEGTGLSPCCAEPETREVIDTETGQVVWSDDTNTAFVPSLRVLEREADRTPVPI